MSGYNIFVAKKHVEIKESLKSAGKPHGAEQVQKVISDLWMKMTDLEKARYEHEANVRNGEIFIDNDEEEEKMVEMKRIKDATTWSGLTQNDPIRLKMLQHVKQYLVFKLLQSTEGKQVDSNAVLSWARHIEQRLFTNSDVKSYMDYDTFEKRVSDIEKTLFESQDMNEAPWKLSREWCVNVGDKDRDSTREALKNFVLDASHQRLDTLGLAKKDEAALSQHVQCMEQIMYESSSDLSIYKDSSTLENRMKLAFDSYNKQRGTDFRLWYASKFSKIRT